jgi:hypothetical protein
MSGYKVAARSRKAFFEYANGLAGATLVHAYSNTLTDPEFILKLPPSLAMHFFVATISAAGDVWKRLCYDMLSFPWLLFSIANHHDSPIQEEKWNLFYQAALKCRNCLDQGLSNMICTYLTEGSIQDTSERKRKEFAVSQLLLDIATYSDLSSDATEALHGRNRHDFWHAHGRYKDSDKCTEQSLLNSVNKAYNRLSKYISSKTMPPCKSTAGIQRMTKEMKSGTTSAVKRKFLKPKRILSGWNIFQKESIGDKLLSKEQYKLQLKEIGRKWQLLSADDKSVYYAVANAEQRKRDCLMSTPLPVKPKTSTIDNVGRRIWHRLSSFRLKHNEHCRATHPDFGSVPLADAYYSLDKKYLTALNGMTTNEVQEELEQTFHYHDFFPSVATSNAQAHKQAWCLKRKPFNDYLT